MNVLLLASGFNAQYRVLRCVAELGHTLFAAGEGLSKLLAASRHVARFFELALDNRAIVSQLNNILRDYRIELVLPSDAKTTRLLASIGSTLEAKIFPVPDPETFDTLNDKSRFIRLCAQLGIPHPRSCRVARRSDLAQMVRDWGPGDRTVVKPLDRSGGIGVRVVERHELGEVHHLIDYEPLLLQQFVEGEDASIGLFCVDGEPLLGAAYRRVAGNFELLRNNKLFEYASAITRHCKFRGVVNFDARMAPDGSVELIECNPRFFFPIDLMMILGVNFVEVGINGLAQRQTPVVIHDKRLRLPKRLLVDLLSVRKFEPRDWQHLRYKLSDPLPGLMWFLGYQSKWSSRALDALLMRACRTQRLP